MSDGIGPQHLQPAVAQNNHLICDACWDGLHRSCEHQGCDCLCLTPKPPRKYRPRRDRKSGLTAIEKRLQSNLAFDPSQALIVKPEPLNTRTKEKP